MKTKINFFVVVFFSFLLCILFGYSRIEAGNCDATVAGLRVKCNAASSLDNLPESIRSTAKRYDAIDINNYKYQGYGYDFNSLSDYYTFDFDERSEFLDNNQQAMISQAAKTVASAEKYISVTGGLGNGSTVKEKVMAGTEKINSGTYSNIMNSPGYGVNYLYSSSENFEKLFPYENHINVTIVRGANSIIFQDKYSDYYAYNRGYVYEYCESKFIWCWSWSDYIQKDVYTRTNSKGVYDPITGKLTYTDLSSVQMILPSFEVRQEFPSEEIINGRTYYSLNHLMPDGPYSSDNQLMRDVHGSDGHWWYHRRSQSFFTYLIMKYTATVSFYYKDDAASNSNIVVLRKATLPVSVYVVYEATAGGEYTKVMLALNGYSYNGFQKNSRLSMPKDGISSNISLIPVQYDMSMILDPSYWTTAGFKDTGEVVSVLATKVSSYATKKFANKTIYMNTIGIDENGIDITATGIYTRNVLSTVTLFASGKIYYSYEEMDFVDFSFTYQIDGGEVVDLTPYMASYLSSSGVCEKCNIPVNVTPIKASSLIVNVDGNGDDIELKIYSTTDALKIKNYKGTDAYLSASYVSQGKGKTSDSYSSSMSVSKLIVVQVVYFGVTYFVAFTFDNIAPELTSLSEVNNNGKYIVVESEDELRNIGFVAKDDISSTIEQVSDKCSLVNKGNRYEYTLVIKDEAGNESTYVFDVIIDSENPTSIKGTAILPNGNLSLAPHSGTYGEVTVESDVYIDKGDLAALNLLDSYFGVELNSISSLYDLSSLEPYNAVLVDDSDTFSLDVIVKDYGVYGYTSAGMRGIYVKSWIDSDGESGSVWQYMSHGVYNSVESTYNIPLSSGTNYIVIASMDYVNHLYKQDGTRSSYKINLKIYAITVYGTPYISEIIATEDGFGAIVRDDLSIFKAPGVSTSIEDYVIVDAEESDKTFDSYSTSSLAIKTILDTKTSNSMVLAIPNLRLLNKTVTKNKSYSYLSDYLEEFEDDVGLIPYSQLLLSSRLSASLRTKDLNLNTFDNQMLIRGMLLNGQAYIYARVVINTSPNPVEMFQRISFATSYTKSNSPTLELTNSYTEENTGNLDNIFSISGEDEVSYWRGTDMIIKYDLDMYKQSDSNSRTGNAEEDIYRADNFIIYYKSCYQTEGTFGATTVCSGDSIRYYDGDGINLGKVNPNYLYKVYVGVVVALEYDVATGTLTERYNNDSGYSVVSFASSKFLMDNDVSLHKSQLKETYYETYYGMFLYDTSIPEVYVEYTTIYEYNPDGINKLKDVNYAAELGEMKNFIIKITIKYESDKFRKPAYWTRLDKNSIYWFPYYYSTGKSVCGNVDRIKCGYDKAFTAFGLEEAISNSNTTYDPDVGLVYYLQYPTSEDIAKVSAAYSVDVFDLIVKLETTNGLTNKGMDLIVDNVTREQNKEYLTIYYDQDGPKIVITSSPDKDATYYAVSIMAEDVSSNVAKVSFYYGKYDVENPDAESFLLYEEVVNEKTFSGYSARLTQKGWYTVLAEDEFGQLTTYYFEVVQVGDGVMYSPTLDDTDQLEDNDNKATKVAVTIIASVVSVIVIVSVIALIVGVIFIYIKYGWVIKKTKKAIKKAKPIAKYTKNIPGWVGAASKVVDAIPEEMVDDKPKEAPQEEQPPPEQQESDQQSEGENG